MVKLVSAMDVASTILRFPAGAGTMAWSWALRGRFPKSGAMIQSGNQTRVATVEAMAMITLMRRGRRHAPAVLRRDLFFDGGRLDLDFFAAFEFMGVEHPSSFLCACHSSQQERLRSLRSG